MFPICVSFTLPLMQPLNKTAHTHALHSYFLYFLLKCKPKKFLALILKPDLKQSQCPPGTMTLHCLPSLCRLRTENSLAVGKRGRGRKKPKQTITKKTNKMLQTKNHKPVTQTKILFCSRFTAQREILLLACRQVGAKQDSLFSFLCLRSLNEMSVQWCLTYICPKGL